MDKKFISQSTKIYDSIVCHTQGDNIEFWYARDVMPLLGYTRWENFSNAITRAMNSCKTSGVSIDDHFREVTKMIIYRQWWSTFYTRLCIDTLRMLPHCPKWRSKKA